MYFRHLVLAACLLLLSGCGIIDYFFLPPPEDTAQELYEGANDAMQEKNYSQAAQYYTKLKDNFPFSPYTVEAELSLGDAFFLDGKYPEAAEAYKEFESLHPRHEAIPYVLYQVGMSNLKSFISLWTGLRRRHRGFGILRTIEGDLPEQRVCPEICRGNEKLPSAPCRT